MKRIVYNRGDVVVITTNHSYGGIKYIKGQIFTVTACGYLHAFYEGSNNVLELQYVRKVSLPLTRLQRVIHDITSG